MFNLKEVVGFPEFLKRSPRLAVGVLIVGIAFLTYALLSTKSVPPPPVDLTQTPIAGEVKNVLDETVVVTTQEGDRVFKVTSETIFKNGTVSDIVPGNKVFAVGKKDPAGVLVAYKVYFNSLDEQS
jgi:hypothetical protein